MKFCESCGAANEDHMLTCADCGMALPISSSATRTGNVKIPKQILIICGCVVALTGLIFGGIFLANNFDKGGKVESASRKTVRMLSAKMETATNLNRFTENLEQRMLKGEYSQTITYSTNDYRLELHTDFDRSEKVLQGNASYANERSGIQLSLDYSAEKDDVQLALPEGKSNTYGFSLKNLNEQLEKSILTTLLPIKVPEKFEIDLFADAKKQNLLKTYGGETYDALVESIKVEDLKERKLYVADREQSVWAYRVTWSSKAAANFLSAAGGSEMLSWLGDLVNSILPELEPECLVFLNEEGQLIGVDFVSLGTNYVFILEGQENLWDKFTLTVKSLYADTVVYTGETHKTFGSIRMFLEGPDGILCDINYEDDTGEFSVKTRKLGEILHGTLVGMEEKSECVVSLNLPDTQDYEVYLIMESLQSEPKQLAKTYIDLLDMSLSDCERLLLDMGIRIPGT